MSVESLIARFQAEQRAKDLRKRKLGLATIMSGEEFNDYIDRLINDEKLTTDIYEEFNVDFCWRCGKRFEDNYYPHRISLQRVHSKKVNPIKRIITTELKDLTVNECLECHNYRLNQKNKRIKITRFIIILLIVLSVVVAYVGFYFLNWDWTHCMSLVCILILSIGTISTIGQPIIEIVISRSESKSAKFRKDSDIPIVRFYIQSGFGIGE